MRGSHGNYPKHAKKGSAPCFILDKNYFFMLKVKVGAFLIEHF